MSFLKSTPDIITTRTHNLRRQRYVGMDFQTSDLESAVGAKVLLSDDKATVLMGRMRNPSLSLRKFFQSLNDIYLLIYDMQTESRALGPALVPRLSFPLLFTANTPSVWYQISHPTLSALCAQHFCKANLPNSTAKTRSRLRPSAVVCRG